MNESPWDELDIKELSNREQSESGLDGLSESLAFFFQSLARKKFTRDEAMQIVLQYMKSAFDASRANNGQD